MRRFSPHTIAAAAILLAVFLTTLQDTAIKAISGDYPFHQMQSIRAIATMPVVLAFVLYETRRLAAIFDPDWAYISLRGLLHAIGSASFYVTLATLPYAEASALYFTMPLIVALLAGPLLGEHVRWHRAIAILVGFAGVVIIINPGSGVFEPTALLAVFAALCYSVANLMTRSVGPAVTTSVVAFYTNLFFLLTALALSVIFGLSGFEQTGHPGFDYMTRAWVMPTTRDLLVFAGIGLMTGFLMILFTLPYRLADVSFVAPFEYSQLLWAMLAAYIFLGEVPGTRSLGGIALIAGAGLFMLAMDSYTKGETREAGGQRWHRAVDRSGPRPVRGGPVLPQQIQRTGARRGPPGRTSRHADRRS